MAVTPRTLKTLDDVVNYSTRYNINKIMFYTQTDDKSLIISDSNLFDIYMRLIAPYVGTYTVTENNRVRYKYKPYLLSLDVYGTPDLAWLILKLNDRECASKFYLKSTIRLIPIDIIDNLYDTIATKSNDTLKKNWNQYLPLIGKEL